MPEVLACIEHQTIRLVDIRTPGEPSITVQQAALLAKIKTLPAKAIAWGHQSIKFSQFCGILQLGDLTIEVLPKLYGKESQPGACRGALIQMLRKSGLLKLHRLGDADVNVQKHTLLDVFILDFCSQLSEQIKQGKLRQYITIEENLPVLRGRLLMNYQMRHNLAHKERLYCQYDELHEDILVNRIFKYTLRLLLNRSRSDAAKKAIFQLLFVFDSISDTPITPAIFERLIIDRFNARFEKVLTLCRMFIQHLNPDLHAGQQNSFAMMFDMNRLFESWVAAVMRPIAHSQGLKLREQGPKKYLAYRADLDKQVFQMRPDISLLDSTGIPILIADAKWKLLDASEAKLGVTQADLYQMQSYANRYRVESLMLIYPRQHGLSESYELQMQGQLGVSLQITTIDIAGEATVGNSTRNFISSCDVSQKYELSADS